MIKKNLVTGTEGWANYFSIATPKKCIPTLSLSVNVANSQKTNVPSCIQLSNYFLPPTSLATSGFPTSASVVFGRACFVAEHLAMLAAW